MRDVYAKLMDLLDPRERRNFRLLMLLVLVMGLANMVGVAAVLPLLAVMADPGIIETNRWLAALYARSGADTPLAFLIPLGAGVVAFYVGGLVLKTAVTYALVRFGTMRNHTWAQRMLARYLAQPYVWFLGRHSADLSKNILTEVRQVSTGVLIPALNLVVNGIIVLLMLVLLVAVDPLSALFIGALIGGAYAALYAILRPRLARLGGERVAANRARHQIAQEGLAGIKEVKVLGLEHSMLRRFGAPSHRMAAVEATAAIIKDFPRNLLEALAFGGMMTVVLVLAVTNEGDLGAILPVVGVYAVAGMRIFPAAQAVYVNLAAIRFGKPALDSLHADYTAASPDLPPRPAQTIRLRDRLVLEGVDYAYPGAERGALRGLSLEIRANATVGVVGGTGAGKTTAIDVIMGLLAPQGGRLSVDGRPVETEDDRRAWRASVGYVPQQIFLVDASVARNIAFGVASGKIDHDAVERAARLAQLHDFVTTELPRGYATEVGDRGVRLSGGQRQRIGIARALYHDPDALVLDEATSALDNITERALMEAVRGLGGRKTVIMVAHRLTTVMGCDEIFLLERGRVAARGTYAELLERSPAFREMAEGADTSPRTGTAG